MRVSTRAGSGGEAAKPPWPRAGPRRFKKIRARLGGALGRGTHGRRRPFVGGQLRAVAARLTHCGVWGIRGLQGGRCREELDPFWAFLRGPWPTTGATNRWAPGRPADQGSYKGSRRGCYRGLAQSRARSRVGAG
ncbi:unnamed protein product [Calypogeia fissa]